MLPRRLRGRKLKQLVKYLTFEAANHEEVGEVTEVKEVEEAGIRDIVISNGVIK
jgi:hypothetical protein